MHIGIIRTFFIIFAIFCTISCDIASNKANLIISHSAAGTTSAYISNDTKWVVSAALNGKAYLYKIGELSPTYIWQHSSINHPIIYSTYISSDSKYAATASDHEVALWSIQTGKNIGYWQMTAAKIRAIAVSSPLSQLVIAQDNGTISLINFNLNQIQHFTQHSANINAIVISQDGTLAASASNDYTVLIWRIANLEIIQNFTHLSRITQLAMSQDNKLMFSADAKQAKIWQISDRTLIGQLEPQHLSDVFTSARFNHNASLLITGSPGKKIQLWQMPNGKLKQEWRVATNNQTKYSSAVVHSAAFYNNQVVSESSAGNTEFWQIE